MQYILYCTCLDVHVHVLTYSSKPLRLRDYISKLVKLLFVCTKNFVACACHMFVCLFLSLLSFLLSFYMYL